MQPLRNLPASLLPPRGLTLIELMVAVVIVGIVASMAGPSLWSWLKELRLAKASNEIQTSLIQARNEAIRTQERVSVCRTGNVYANDPDCGADIYGTSTSNASREWTYGWLVYTNPGTTAAYPYDPGNHTLVAAINNGLDDDQVIITSNAAAQNVITFRPDGRISGASPVLAICDERDGGDDDEFGYLVEFATSGRAVKTKFKDLVNPTCAP